MPGKKKHVYVSGMKRKELPCELAKLVRLLSVQIQPGICAQRLRFPVKCQLFQTQLLSFDDTFIHWVVIVLLVKNIDI